jgi:hypothetical protein
MDWRFLLEIHHSVSEVWIRQFKKLNICNVQKNGKFQSGHAADDPLGTSVLSGMDFQNSKGILSRSLRDMGRQLPRGGQWRNVAV